MADDNKPFNPITTSMEDLRRTLGERIVRAARLAAAMHLAASAAEPIPTGAMSIGSNGPIVRREDSMVRTLAA